MYRIDINNIKRNTTEKITYSIYEGKIVMKRKKIKNFVFCIGVLSLFVFGTMAVNAMTDNSIVNGVKSVFKIKVNNKDYNTKCEKLGDGSFNCTINEENGEKQFKIVTNETK